MRTSSDLDKIAQALVAVSKAIGPVLKNKEGYGYKYADLVAICNELAPILLENDLVVLEGGGDDDYSDPEMVSCQLRIQHVSGQWIETGILRVKVNPASKRDGTLKPLGPQDYMIVYSYLRRYLLVSAFMIPTVDNDAIGPRDDPPKGNGKKPASAAPKSPPAPLRDAAIYGLPAERKAVGARVADAMKTKGLDKAALLTMGAKISGAPVNSSDDLTLAEFKTLADEIEMPDDYTYEELEGK